jgi:hypothetical protein
MMRRLLAINLPVVLLAPWIAALSGTAVLVVPCPMHRSVGATNHGDADAMAGSHHKSAEHQNGSHHGTSARGCNCAGECGRSGGAFSLAVAEHVSVGRGAVTDPIFANDRSDFAPATRLLPLATGPPQRLRI